jgi:hypothetical protein
MTHDPPTSGPQDPGGSAANNRPWTKGSEVTPHHPDHHGPLGEDAPAGRGSSQSTMTQVAAGIILAAVTFALVALIVAGTWRVVRWLLA